MSKHGQKCFKIVQDGQICQDGLLWYDNIFSPICTPEILIKKYPKIDFFICENDPLHDDEMESGSINGW